MIDVDIGYTTVSIDEDSGVLIYRWRTIAISKINSTDITAVSGHFPLWSILVIVISLIVFNFSGLWGFILLLIAVLRLGLYFYNNPTYGLNLHTSSTESFRLVGNKEKLIQFQGLLMQLLNKY